MLHDIIDQVFLDHHRHDNPSPPPHISASAMSVDETQPATCPVDHKSREAWLEKAKIAAAASSSESNSPTTPLPPSHPPISTSTSSNTDGCPVDHGAREVWIQQARAASEAASTSATPSTTTTTSSWSSYLPRIPFLSSTSTPSSKPNTSYSAPGPSRLGIDREVSTIPRTSSPPSDPRSPRPAPAAATAIASSDHPPSPANNEQETGADLATGNWIYPSERMFFDAMKRKGHDPRAADMRTVVPIHNAVNERAWAEIKAWEAPWVEGSR